MTRRRIPAPRWQTPLPDGVVGSWGPDVAAYAASVLGITLDRWQRRALNRALVYGADGRLLHRTYLISTARQNGKTAAVRSLIGWALTYAHGPDWHRLLGLAHDRKQARLPYEAVMADLGPLARRYGPVSRGGLSVTRYLGIRSALHGRAREYHTGSREARDAIRGESTDLGLFDEIRTQRDLATWAALEPTTTARPEPLIVGISTAGDDRSVLLRAWFERGRRIIDGAEPMADFGMTWYAAPDDADPATPAAFLAANPAVAEGRIARAAIVSAIASSGGADSAMYRSERLNLWADGVDEWLPAGIWPRQSGPQPDDHGRVILGVEAVPSWRRATITVAVPTADGAWTAVAGELDASRTDASSVPPAALVALLGDVAATWRPAAIAYSLAAAAAPHVEAWATANDVPTVKLGSVQLRAASELFRSELIGGRLWHPDDPLLALQVRAARPSHPIESGSWYLSIRESTGEIDAVRAAAWASWAAIAPSETDLPPQVFV